MTLIIEPKHQIIVKLLKIELVINAFPPPRALFRVLYCSLGQSRPRAIELTLLLFHCAMAFNFKLASNKFFLNRNFQLNVQHTRSLVMNTQWKLKKLHSRRFRTHSECRLNGHQDVCEVKSNSEVEVRESGVFLETIKRFLRSEFLLVRELFGEARWSKDFS